MELITSNPKSPACLLRGWARLASPPRSPALCPQDVWPTARWSERASGAERLGRDERREFLGFQCTGTKPRPSPHHMKRWN